MEEAADAMRALGVDSDAVAALVSQTRAATAKALVKHARQKPQPKAKALREALDGMGLGKRREDELAELAAHLLLEKAERQRHDRRHPETGRFVPTPASLDATDEVDAAAASVATTPQMWAHRGAVHEAFRPKA